MQKLLILILLAILSIYSSNCFASIKAVQISYLNVKNLIELEKEFVKIKKNGFNTIIFRVFHNKGDRFYPFIKRKNDCGVYFKTRYLPCVNNCLGKICSLAHQHNLKLIAWMQTRYLDCKNFSANRKVFKFDFKGNKFKVSRGLSFFNKKNFNFILKVYLDLLKYPIDGILLQDDLKILIDEDFNPEAIKIFYKKTKIKLSENNVKKILYGSTNSRKHVKPTKYFFIWQNIKSAQIKKFLDFLTFNLKTKKKIKIFMNVSYEFLINSHLSKKWYGYDYETLKNTLIDKFVVMMYQEQIKKELKISDKQYYKLASAIIKTGNKLNKKRFIFKIQSYNWYIDKRIKKRVIENLLTFLKINNIKNFAIFPYYKNMF